jgi:hypothetical protein
MPLRRWPVIHFSSMAGLHTPYTMAEYLRRGGQGQRQQIAEVLDVPVRTRCAKMMAVRASSRALCLVKQDRVLD